MCSLSKQTKNAERTGLSVVLAITGVFFQKYILKEYSCHCLTFHLSTLFGHYSCLCVTVASAYYYLNIADWLELQY